MNSQAQSQNHNRAAEANQVTWVGLWLNLALTVFKFIAGILGRSSAMIADAVHSVSDFVTDVVLLASFRIVGKPVDDSHDYGHGKFETLASNFVGATLLLVGLGILFSGGEKIYSAFRGEILPQPGWIALLAAAVSIALKEFLYRYQAGVGRRINSSAVVANAWHHRSDALSSIATMFGIAGAIFLGESWRVLDPIAAILVSLLILKVAVPIFWSSLKELLEASLDDDTEKNILETAGSVPGVIDPHNLRTRRIGSYVAVDIHIRVDKSLNIVEAHDISRNVELKLKDYLGEESFIYVHVDPAEG